jgi:peroxiredoxin
MAMVTTGQKAPDFAAAAVQDGEARGLELFGEVDSHDAVVLAFEPADFVPTCTAELSAIRDADWHATPGLSVVALTGDSLFSHAAYADQYDFRFPLVSDFHASIAESYDLHLDTWESHSHVPGRATVVIDDDWTVRAIESAPPLSGTSPTPVERAATALQKLGIDVASPEIPDTPQ